MINLEDYFDLVDPPKEDNSIMKRIRPSGKVRSPTQHQLNKLIADIDQELGEYEKSPFAKEFVSVEDFSGFGLMISGSLDDKGSFEIHIFNSAEGFDKFNGGPYGHNKCRVEIEFFDINELIHWWKTGELR